VLLELSRRGYRTIDTDYDGWVLADGTRDQPRMAALLTSAADQFAISRDVLDVEPALRTGATLELDGRRPVDELANEVERLITGSDPIETR
jgi:hypothetical protein